MSDNFVSLTVSTSPTQQSIIEESLKRAAIEYTTLEEPRATAILGRTSAVGCLEFLVTPEQLEEAKDALCASGVVCEVTEHLLRRSMEDIVRPLLSSSEPDFGQLIRFIELNNKESVLSLFEATLACGGGRELLEDLFFVMSEGGRSGLIVLAQALNDNTTASFAERFRSAGSVGPKEARTALLKVLAEFSASPWHLEVLATALMDRDSEIREAAGEALHSLRGEDCGYDPEDPPAEREAVVQEILSAADLS